MFAKLTEDLSAVNCSGPNINGKQLRLHPLRDGVIPLVSESRVRHRDSGGNKYTEVTNPQTGWCTGVTSPLTFGEDDGPVLDPRPMVPKHNPTRDQGVFPKLIGEVWVQGTGNNRHAVRTVDMGDKAIPSMPSRRSGTSTRKSATRTTQTPSRASVRSARPASPATVPAQMIDIYIQTVAKKALGKKWRGPVKITREMRKLARLELARKADIAAYCQND